MVCVLLTNNNLFAMQEDDKEKGRALEREASSGEFISETEDATFVAKQIFVTLTREKDDDDPDNVAALESVREIIFKVQELYPKADIVVNLNSFGLRTIRDSFFEGMTNVIELDISDNQLTQKVVRQICCNLPNLSVLHLSRNGLKKLPSEIGRLTNLKFLDLAYNNLRELPVMIESLKDLEVLFLGNNCLTQESIQYICRLITNLQLKNLQNLDLSGNQLSREVVRDIYLLKNLHKLYLSGNQLSRDTMELIARQLQRSNVCLILI